MDKSATCQLMAINWRTVGTIVERVVAQRLDARRLEELSLIGVDEVSHRRHHQYLTVVVAEGNPQDLLKSRNSPGLLDTVITGRSMSCWARTSINPAVRRAPPWRWWPG
jgi:hypothetical protein